MDKLHELWKEQIAYNEKIRQIERANDKEYWSKQYLLGIVSEIDEILQEINWKIHRRGHPTNRHNLARELADMTKYLWCLWELHGFTADDMLKFVEEKSNELKEQHRQDFEYKPMPGAPVIITDIDGTLGDWRKAFFDWTWEKKVAPLNYDAAKTMNIEIDLGLPYPKYLKLKEEFEAEGGYKLLEVYPDAKRYLDAKELQGVEIIAYTARPSTRYSRIWSDTWEWILKNKLAIKELRIGSEERISRACQLLDEGHKVLMLEDDPSLALRAASTGVRVILRHQPYNVSVKHKNIVRILNFDEVNSYMEKL